MTKRAAVELQGEWETMVNCHPSVITGIWISRVVLRPFLFFIRCLSIQHQTIQTRDIGCMQKCFKILLDSLNSSGMPVLWKIFFLIFKLQ